LNPMCEFPNRLPRTGFIRLLPVATLAIALVIGGARETRAQGFVSPFIASSFGGNVGCQGTGRAGVSCVDGSVNVGVTVGAMWHFVGFEEEVAYRPDFLGNIPSIGWSSSALTFMSNVMLAPEIGPVRPYVLGGKLRAYAVLAETRWFATPDIPTTDEAGAPGLHISFWHGLWAPSGTPSAVIGRLNGAVVEAFSDTSMRRTLTDLGVDIPATEQLTPQALGAFHKAEIEKWWPIIKAAGVQVE